MDSGELQVSTACGALTVSVADAPLAAYPASPANVAVTLCEPAARASTLMTTNAVPLSSVVARPAELPLMRNAMLFPATGPEDAASDAVSVATSPKVAGVALRDRVVAAGAGGMSTGGVPASSRFGSVCGGIAFVPIFCVPDIFQYIMLPFVESIHVMSTRPSPSTSSMLATRQFGLRPSMMVPGMPSPVDCSVRPPIARLWETSSKPGGIVSFIVQIALAPVL